MLANFSFRAIVEYLPLFGQGLVATLWLSLVSFAGALATTRGQSADGRSVPQ
jgi:glutamine transport system permease protein